METPYASDYHVPILVAEVLDLLNIKEATAVLDGTLGGGGHSHAILEHNPDASLIAIDRDPDAIAYASKRLESFGERVTFLQSNYGSASEHLDQRFDAILIDAGVSSHQLDDDTRGFSFRNDGPLDMRMSQEGESLEEYLQRVDENELASVIRTYGEVPASKRVARAILAAFEAGKITGTESLADVVKAQNPMPRKSKVNPATLVFQALRIELNDELDDLKRALQTLPDLLAIGGRIGVIAFHSLEDRIVKQRFKALSTDSTPKGVPMSQDQLRIWGKVITRKPVSPSEEEIARNPRARSAKFRVLERTSEESCATF